MFRLLTPLDGDTAGAIFDQIAAEFLQNTPDAERRSTDAIRERWKKMLESYRYARQLHELKARYIIDFTAGRVKGSTGRAPWFDLNSEEQKECLKKKVH